MKREKAAVEQGRPPIGKSGIGNWRATFKDHQVCTSATMDYTRIGKEADSKKLSLSVRKLGRTDVERAIPFVIESGVDLFSKDADSWTVVVIDNLKQTSDVANRQERPHS